MTNIVKKNELERLVEHIGDRAALDPEDIVSRATPVSSPLHNYFEWDDRKASHQYRLQQARALIRAIVTILPAVDTEPVRAFISLSDLRGKQGGSYVATATVLSDEEMYAQARADGITALVGMQKRLRYIKEFEPIWHVLARVIAQIELETA